MGSAYEVRARSIWMYSGQVKCEGGEGASSRHRHRHRPECKQMRDRSTVECYQWSTIAHSLAKVKYADIHRKIINQIPKSKIPK